MSESEAKKGKNMVDYIPRQAAINVFCEYACGKGFTRATCDCDCGSLFDSIPSLDLACYGYDVEKLLMFAVACRNSGVTNEDLRVFANNLDFAWREVQSSIKGTFENTISQIMKRGCQDG